MFFEHGSHAPPVNPSGHAYTLLCSCCMRRREAAGASPVLLAAPGASRSNALRLAATVGLALALLPPPPNARGGSCCWHSPAGRTQPSTATTPRVRQDQPRWAAGHRDACPHRRMPPRLHHQPEPAGPEHRTGRTHARAHTHTHTHTHTQSDGGPGCCAFGGAQADAMSRDDTEAPGPALVHRLGVASRPHLLACPRGALPRNPHARLKGFP